MFWNFLVIFGNFSVYDFSSLRFIFRWNSRCITIRKRCLNKEKYRQFSQIYCFHQMHWHMEGLEHSFGGPIKMQLYKKGIRKEKGAHTKATWSQSGIFAHTQHHWNCSHFILNAYSSNGSYLNSNKRRNRLAWKLASAAEEYAIIC